MKRRRRSRETKWEEIPYSWVRMLNIIKITIFPKQINKLDAISFKIPVGLLAEVKLMLKFTLKTQSPQKPKQS
jgi:hypothetical protein